MSILLDNSWQLPPSLVQPFADEYSTLSMHISELSIPKTCNLYFPDYNDDDFACRTLAQPAPELGAPIWTSNDNKRLLIGIYRDEGRQPAQAPPKAMTWSRAGTSLVVVVESGGHQPYFTKGDKAIIYNGNIPSLTTTVISAGRTAAGQQAFTCLTDDTGSNTGAGTFQPTANTNFYEDYIVFRLLPDMRIMPVSQVLALFAEWEPIIANAQDELIDVVTGNIIRVGRSFPRVDRLANGSDVTAIHRQQFAKNEYALQQTYDATGIPIPSAFRYTRTQNQKRLIEPAKIPLESGLRVYDYYGFALNAANRSPFLAADLITYDALAPAGLKRKTVNNIVAYAGPLFDEFGLKVIGAFDEDQLMLRDFIYPARVDQLNVPYRTAAPRDSALLAAKPLITPYD